MRTLVLLCVIALAVNARNLRKVSPINLDEQPTTGCYKIVMPKIHLTPGQPIGPIIPTREPISCSSENDTVDTDLAEISSNANHTCYKLVLPTIHLQPGQPIGPIFPINEPVSCSTPGAFSPSTTEESDEEFDVIPTNTSSNHTCYKIVMPMIHLKPDQPIGPIIPTFEPIACSSENEESDEFFNIPGINTTNTTQTNRYGIILPPISIKPNQPIGPIFPIYEPEEHVEPIDIIEFIAVEH